MSSIASLLDRAVRSGASDVHLKPGRQPFMRVNGQLLPAAHEILDIEALRRMAEDIIPPHIRRQFEENHEADFSHREPDVGRFRVNLFFGQGEPTIAMRHVKDDIPTIESLHLPESVHRLADFHRGIVLVTGTTGSGKSTTLAAVIGEINRNHAQRIITIEDPIEYTFIDESSLITQREIGIDTLSFASALKNLMRQDPDTILIGEMRDADTIRTAIMAAETGHLVFSTLHAGSASQALPRILDVFPTDEQDQIRMSMAENLAAAMCQRLVPDTAGGVVPAVELLFNTPTVRKLMATNKLDVLAAAIETGGDSGMQSFNQSIYHFIKQGVVTEKEGMRFATNPEQLKMNLQGIFLDESRRILSSS